MRIIAGPCQHESLEQSLEIARTVNNICRVQGVEYIFKASFDKANRSSDSGIRGIGFNETMRDFLEMKKEIPGLKILTDVHSTTDISAISYKYNDAVDVLQIPAFLCRQTDIVKHACMTDKIVNIKKGQFLAPWDVAGIMSKTKEANKEVWITERGTSFGYNTLVVDYTGLQYLLDTYGSSNVVMDATHAVQKPGGNGTSSGGNRAYVPTIAKAAAAIGVRNFFMETHPDPDTAPSDGPNMVRLDEMEKLIAQIRIIHDNDKNNAWNWR
jgi:2-dehydro-3-deoxyphosphooctonate aldolase (KDO 8-P synthase)